MQESGQQIPSSVVTRKRFLVAYAIVFCAVLGLAFSPYLRAGTSLIWPTDGLYQHYNAFVYLGSWYRTIIKNLFVHHKLLVPMWEFGIGYGNDIITTLAHYTLNDPFILFSIITPTRYAETGYIISVFARMFCSGLAFSVYSTKMNCTYRGTFCGAIAYAFCGYALFFSGSHTYFISSLVWLPLLFYGVECIYDQRDPRCYLIVTCISLASNFYFYYMQIVFVILYIIIRGFELYHGHIGKVIKFGLLVALYTLIGTAMAAIVFLPVIQAYFDSSRSVSAYTFSNTVSQREIVDYLISLITLGNARYSGFIGLSPMVLVGVASSLPQRRLSTWAKVYLLILMVFLVFPVFGYALNGFGYVSNRWVFCFALICCFLFASASDNFEELGIAQKIATVAILGGYAAICIFSDRVADTLMSSFRLLGISALVVMALGPLSRLVATHGGSEKTAHVFVGTLTTALVVAGVLVLSHQQFVDGLNGFAANHVASGEASSTLSRHSIDPRYLESDSAFFRVDTGRIGRSATNPPIWWKQSTTTQYWSIVPGVEKDFLMLNSAYEELTYRTRGLLSRTLLLPLFSIEYFFTRGNCSYQVPYGFERVDTSLNGYDLYHTDLSLPLGYSYDSYVPESEFENMSIAERQQAMLQGAVIEDGVLDSGSTIEHLSPAFTDEELPFEVTDAHGASLEGNVINVTKANADLVLRVDCPAEREMYVCFYGMHFKGQKGAASAFITASSSGCVTAPTYLYTNTNRFEHGREDYLLNLYYSSEARDKVVLHFSNVGTYTFTRMGIVAQPLDDLSTRIEALREDVLEDIKIDTNAITASYRADKDKVLCISIPYTEGWHLSVDGEERDPICVNSMFLGVVLNPGVHELSLVYETPHLREGACISAVGFLLFALLCLMVRLQRKKTGAHD